MLRTFTYTVIYIYIYIILLCYINCVHMLHIVAWLGPRQYSMAML